MSSPPQCATTLAAGAPIIVEGSLEDVILRLRFEADLLTFTTVRGENVAVNPAHVVQVLERAAAPGVASF